MLLALVPAVGTALLGLGVLGLVPMLPAVSAAAVISTSVNTALLLRFALSIHHLFRSYGPCRGAGLIGLGVLSTALTSVGIVFSESTPGVAAGIATGGLIVAILLYVVGMLLLPGAAPTFVIRLRRALDGLGIGVCFLFVVWVLMVTPRHPAADLSLVVATATSAAIAIAAVTGLRAVRYRPAALAACAGSAMSVLGLAGLALVLQGAAGALWLPLAGCCLVYGPILSVSGARRCRLVPGETEPEETATSFAGYPALAIPVALVLAAAVYHMITAGGFDMVGAGLGCGVVAALTIREAFGAFDVRWFTKRVASQEAHFRSLVSGSSDVTMVLDTDLIVRWQSPAAARQFGLSDQDVLGRSFVTLLHPDDGAAVRDRFTEILTATSAESERPALVEARLRDGFGHWRDTESTVSDQRAVPEVSALVVHVRDVGERRELERTLHRMAFTDQLTGLANRRQLLRTVAAMRTVPGQPGSLLVIDLDGFTSINDVRGHEVGDAVLIEVARRLRDGVDESDQPARLAGDEFAVATAGNPVQTYALATRLMSMLIQPYELPGATIHLSASIGLAELAGASSVGDTLSRAALALRRARQMRRGRIEWYDEALEAALLRRLTLEQELPGVVGRGELDLVYQPVVDLVEGRPVGAEALLRWRHPKLGTVDAADFVPVAEDLGLIDEIGVWVLHRSCRQLTSWLRDGRELWLAVNLAARQLAAPGLVATVANALETHQVSADRLVLEVTEQGLGEDTQRAVAQLAGLRALGVRTALANFGTGSTPLAYLRRLPVDMLKVGKVLFAEPAGRTGPATPIMDVVVGLGRRLGLEIIAEGLEAEAHLDVVRGAGCRYGQGFLFSRPAPAEHFEAYLESHRTPTG